METSVQNIQKLEGEDQKSGCVGNKKPANRPAMQIYRPPGLRSDGSTSSSSSITSSTTAVATSTKPKTAAGQKLSASENNDNSQIIENNNKCGESTSSRASSRASNQISSSNGDDQRSSLKRTESSLSSESTPSSQKSFGSNSNKLNGQQINSSSANNHNQYNKRLNNNLARKEQQQKKKVMSEHEIEKAITELRALQLFSHSTQIEQWIGGAFCDEDLAECIGSALCRHAIEGGGGSGVAKLCANFKNSPSIHSFVKGLTIALAQYLEVRQKIRDDHFRMWISFIQFLTELYANLGSDSKGELATIVFDVFNYLLRPPILENVKIQELECLISILIKGGYDLERECPDRLALLKDLIRDAFIDVPEPWARKMILLLLELGASGWKLPTDANEYYFNETTN
ncbi:unnamed protein product [Caenorhabditis angaria]|uniref:MIF4G domain-containing protein n=1 Tax=Caenorhabditis angaria TaxID=860376 RepID=A0A9P1IWY3_9PELO|nr:unnamed protein product [Caenorhabditis angaria]